MVKKKGNKAGTTVSPRKKLSFGVVLAGFITMLTIGSYVSPAWATDYPFFDNMEDTASGNWTCDIPWDYTESFSYSPTYSLTDSPAVSYPNNANISCTLSSSLDLTTAVKPVLKFWNRYALETDVDYGHVEVSGNGGSTWTRLAFVTGHQPGWEQVKIDLAEYGGNPDVMLRFRLTSNSSFAYDGWYIDDVEVDEADAVISYPFSDDMETPSISENNWLSSSWKIGTPGANSSTYSWHSTNYSYSFNTLTLANVIDLTSAQQPQLTFWHKYYYTGHVEVSGSYGNEGTWQRLASYSGSQNDWVQVQIDLSAYAGLPNVRIRFVDEGPTGRWWQIDDISIQGIEPPGPSPDINANGSDDQLFVTTADPVDITAALDPGNMSGVAMDWWVGALTPFGTYWYDSSFTWVKSDTPVSVGQYGLFDLSPTSLLNMPLPLGFYTFFFILDDTPDEIFNEMTWYDHVVVGVSSAALEHQMGDLPDFRHTFKEKMRELMGH